MPSPQEHPIAYTVTASIREPALAEEYVRWLTGGHAGAVLAGGARSASVIRLHQVSASDPIEIETRYEFATRADYDRYLEHTAPALREEGVRLFGVRGVTFRRRVGEIL